MLQDILDLKKEISLKKEKLEELISEYFSKNKDLSIAQCSKDIHMDRATLRALLKRKNVHEKRNKRKINSNFFENIDTEEKAYWLGFLSADGHIGKERNSIKLALSKKDEEHVKKFKESIQSEHDIRTYKTGGYSETAMSAEIVIGDAKMHSDLYNLGLRNLKQNHLLPTKVPNSLIRHYIRGIFDGDGWFTLTDKTREIGFGMNRPILEFVNKKIVESLNIKSRSIKDYKNIARYRINDKLDIKKILDWFYKDSSVYLDRKYNKYKDFCRLYFNADKE